jgi:iron-sulfur cluster repair protein YtfE (RIC family)
MPDVVTALRPDTRDMLAVHKVFRDALAAAPKIVGAASSADPEHAANVASFYANVLAFLHVHHEGEDELVWPKLLERAPEQAARVQEIADQHDTVTERLAVAEQELASWAEKPDVDHGAKLAGALVLLARDLVPHLDQEEAFVLPLVEAHLTVEEYAELPVHGMQHFSGDKVWVLLGLLFEAMPPEQREETLAHMPPPVADFWVNAGRPMFDEFIADVRR